MRRTTYIEWTFDLPKRLINGEIVPKCEGRVERQRSFAESCLFRISASRPSSPLPPRADLDYGGSGYYHANCCLISSKITNHISSKITDHERAPHLSRGGLRPRDCSAGTLAHKEPLRFNFLTNSNGTMRAARERPAAASHHTTQLPQTKNASPILRRQKFEYLGRKNTSTRSTPCA